TERYRARYCAYSALLMVVPKLPRQFLRLRAILFSALPIQMIGQAALPDFSRVLEFLSANRPAQILTT
ncbi:MAG TPA: hypothetical protein VLB46_12425, partial [Pyrinomonadaceae bacterium]|nr:hypothetical protein [Pyrinomonadaceae bacterium]